ncbi:MAG: hypothetical protein IKG22_12020 [Atopobiaceae bacterium]|nr:hypothetical protein [Atopobiaceae bacterium]
MRLVAGDTFFKIRDRAIDLGLTLTGPLSWRSAAFGVHLPEYLIDDYLAIKDLSVWRGPIPDGAYGLLKDGTRVCTPKFTFLLLARLLSVEELALFGLELCGTYVIDKDDPRGFVSDTKPETTLKELTEFLEGCPHAPGIRVAKQALRYVADNSASPMESILVLMLCLPRRLGGFDVPIPELNLWASEILGHAVKDDRKIDLVWRKLKFAFEFDSVLDHTGRDRIVGDAIRRMICDEVGIRVFTVTIGQLEDTNETARVARTAYRYLGMRFRTVDRELRRKNAALFNRLLKLTQVEDADLHVN